MAFQNPTRFATTFRGAAGEAYLKDLWEGLGQELAEGQRVSGSPAFIEVSGDLTVLRMPDPREANEPYAVAVLHSASAAPRVFFLEKAEVPGLPHIQAMVAEVTRETRQNWGPLGDVRNASFMERVRAIVA